MYLDVDDLFERARRFPTLRCSDGDAHAFVSVDQGAFKRCTKCGEVTGIFGSVLKKSRTLEVYGFTFLALDGQRVEFEMGTTETLQEMEQRLRAEIEAADVVSLVYTDPTQTEIWRYNKRDRQWHIVRRRPGLWKKEYEYDSI